MKHIIPFVLLLSFTFVAVAQNGDLVLDGDDAMTAGYYKTAYDYYSQAAILNPSDMQLVYKMGEASRLSNDYLGAIQYYTTVLQSKVARQFPDCHYQLARMFRCNGQYDSALSHYNIYLATLPDNKEYSERARQELRSCEWIMDGAEVEPQHYWVEQESKNINTAASESGAIRIGKEKPLLLYSAITAAGSIGKKEQSNDLVIMQTFQAEYSGKGKIGLPVLNEWGINNKKEHSGNVSIDTLHHVIFFTRCNADGEFANVPCSIYYITWSGQHFSKAKRLGGNVNMEGSSSTQPTAGLLPDSNIILYFASNRPGGIGGFDIWYTILNDKMEPSPCVNLGYPVNTQGDEITPFYSNAEGRLYFSSDWHYGYGGYDVFFSHGQRDAWERPINLGASLNSPANDIYYNQNFDDPYAGYLTSNRSGSFYINGNTCCNDIYHWTSEPAEKDNTPEVKKPCDCQKRKELIRPLLPIALYFDNDRPDPKSKSPLTSLNYFQTYNTYMFRRKEYQQAQFAKHYWHEADSISEAIDHFFDNDVQGNCEKFETFLQLLGQDLKNGRRISLTIEGYASPLHSSDYNFNLSKRRISTIINQIMEYNHGELMHYMGQSNGGSLQLREIAYGSSRAKKTVSSSRRDQSRSVYSVDAARERRIEIENYQYLEDDSTIISCLNLPSRAQHLGTFHVGETSDIEIHLPHTAATEKKLAYIHAGIAEATITGYSTLKPGSDLVIYLRLDNSKAQPLYSTFLPITIRVDGENVTQTMFFEYSVLK